MLMTKSNAPPLFTCALAVLVLALAAPIADADSVARTLDAPVAVSPQYDTTHVYVAPEDFDRFTDSLIATFGAVSYTHLDVYKRQGQRLFPAQRRG